jgi:drug/metabolite transporter (DMT)-like permease
VKLSEIGIGIAWAMAAVVLQSAAAVFVKLAGLASVGLGLSGLLINPWLAAIFAALGTQAACWILALRKLPLSFAYPFMSLVLPLNLFAAYFFFGERIGLANLSGMALIVAGIGALSMEKRF